MPSREPPPPKAEGNDGTPEVPPSPPEQTISTVRSSRGMLLRGPTDEARMSTISELSVRDVISQSQDVKPPPVELFSQNALSRPSTSSQSNPRRSTGRSSGRKWSPFRTRQITPLEEDAETPVSRRLRAEVSILRDMLVTANADLKDVPRRSSGWVVPDERGNLSAPGRTGHTLMERLDELNREVDEANTKRFRTEISGFFILAMYLVIGLTFYTQYEGWSWGFALYFCVVVATTVGYGDQDPIETDGGRLFTCCFVFFGVALVLGLGSYLVLQMLADRRNRVLARERAENRKMRENRTSFVGTLMHSDGILQSALTDASDANVSFLKSLIMPVSLMLMSWVIWIVFFMFYEGEELTFVEAFYLVIISGTTVGFGDISPQTEGGQYFATAWLLVIVVLTTTFLGRVAEYVIPQPDDFRLNDVMLEGPQSVLELCDTDGDGDVEYYEWLECLCLATGKVDTEFIRTAREHFDCLESTGDGKITQQDVDVQQELYTRWKTQQARKELGCEATQTQSPLVHAMGMAWLTITRSNKKRKTETAEVNPRTECLSDTEGVSV